MDILMSFETNGRTDDIDRLLSHHCLRKYEVSFKLVSTEKGECRKRVRVRFNTTHDRERFRTALHTAMGKAPTPPVRASRSIIQRLLRPH